MTSDYCLVGLETISVQEFGPILDTIINDLRLLQKRSSDISLQKISLTNTDTIPSDNFKTPVEETLMLEKLNSLCKESASEVPGMKFENTEQFILELTSIVKKYAGPNTITNENISSKEKEALEAQVVELKENLKEQEKLTNELKLQTKKAAKKEPSNKKETDDEISLLKENLNEKDKYIKEMEYKLQELNDMQNENSRESQEDVEEVEEKYKNRISILRKKEDSYKDKIEELEGDIEKKENEMKKVIKEKKSIIKEFEDKKESYEESEAKVTSLEAKLATAIKNYKAYEESEAKVTSLEAKLATAIKNYKEVQKKVTEHQAEQAELIKAKKSAQIQENEITNLKEQKRKLEQTNKTLEMKKEQLNKELASTKSDLQAKMNAMETMKKKISENKSADDSKKISRNLEAKELELKQMELKVHEYKKAYDEASKDKELQQKEKDQLKKELDNIKKLGLNKNSEKNRFENKEESHFPEWWKGHMKTTVSPTKPTAITANMQECPICHKNFAEGKLENHFNDCVYRNQ